jgi:hypothetical protein
VLGQTCSGPASLVDGPGWSWLSPAFWAGSGPEENISFWAEIGPIHFLGRNWPNTFGLMSPAQLVGLDQPSPFNIIYYILYCFVLFICIHVLKWKNKKNI